MKNQMQDMEQEIIATIASPIIMIIVGLTIIGIVKVLGLE
jgi:hypothetical protein